MTLALPTFADIEAAYGRIREYCVETPVLRSASLDRQLGGTVLLKCENLQATGSFKIRGAINRISVLDDASRQRGVVARSSGNHGLAIAYAGRLFGVAVTVVAPESAPAAKIERMRAYGAEVVLADIFDIGEIAQRLARDKGRIYVPPADDFFIVAGAGTVGLELFRQVAEAGTALDALLVCCSGGGLAAGCGLAAKALWPDTQVLAVEPDGFGKMARSLAAGAMIDNEPGPHTICDALAGPYMAAIPFAIARETVAGALAVTDAEVRVAMRVAFSEFGLAIEPGGAAALAAVLAGRISVAGRCIGVTVTGRNVDVSTAVQLLDASGPNSISGLRLEPGQVSLTAT